MLGISEDEIKKAFNNFFQVLSSGNMHNETLKNQMVLLYTKMKRKRAGKINDHTK